MPGDNSRAYCLFCKDDIVAHRGRLTDHVATKKHIKNAQMRNECSKTPKISEFVKPVITDMRKRAELKLAAFIAEHCSLKTADDLGELIPDLDKNSETLSKIKLHRTKCSGILFFM